MIRDHRLFAVDPLDTLRRHGVARKRPGSRVDGRTEDAGWELHDLDDMNVSVPSVDLLTAQHDQYKLATPREHRTTADSWIPSPNLEIHS